MDNIRSKVTDLPTGWIKEVVIRKSGASAGRSDIYYYSPDGKKCRSKPQMMQYLPEDFDMEQFDFRAGKNVDQLLKKRKRRKDDFNFCKDFDLSGSSSAKRQPKKVKETITVNVLNQEDLEGDKSENKETAQSSLVNRNPAESDNKKRRADDLSQRYTKPKQLFWQRRLQNLKPVNAKTEEPIASPQIDNLIKDLLPGSNNQAMLNSVWYSLFINNKVVGQQNSVNALRKHPAALCNVDQPFTAPIVITDEMVHAQEKRVESARKKLTEAQELLKALEDEDIDDLDDMEE